ncbi:MAG: VOC family protein [Maricaulaceae bacterium]|jgi:uncharacterized glyoxalase superfamily protein PhnB
MSETATAETTKPAPQLTGVTPYLMVEGAAAAIAFYKDALGAEEVGERANMDDGRILNSRVHINGAPVMLMDPMPDHGHPAAPHDSYNLHLQVDDADTWFDRAVTAGCEVVMPMSLQFWGDRYGMVKDPFGVTWSFGTTPA